MPLTLKLWRLGTASGRAAPNAFGVKSPTLQAETKASGALALQFGEEGAGPRSPRAATSRAGNPPSLRGKLRRTRGQFCG